MKCLVSLCELMLNKLVHVDVNKLIHSGHNEVDYE